MDFKTLEKTFREGLRRQFTDSEISFLFAIFSEKILQKTRLELRREPNEKITETQGKEFGDALSELKTGKPFQYILGEAEFFGLKFFVDESVLIPRPETEELLELAVGRLEILEPRTESQDFRLEKQEPRIENREPRTKNQEPRTKNQDPRIENREPSTEIQESKIENQIRVRHPEPVEGFLHQAKNDKRKTTNEKQQTTNHQPPTTNHQLGHKKILDIGTGSGIIPVVLKKYFPELEVTALDFSEKALQTAKKNAEFHNAEINFLHADYLGYDLQQNFDVIISNPPYIGNDENPEIATSVKDFEPMMALFSPTDDPLIFYKKIAEDAEKYLNEDGLVFLEINQKYGKETLDLFQNFTEKNLLKDLSGNDRFIIAKK